MSINLRRLALLDVIRGLAAIIVVIYHFSVAFQFDTVATHYLPTGEFSIVVLFMLSGQVLPLGFLARGKCETLISAIVRRVPRLALPMLTASLVSCALAAVGAYDFQERAFTAAGSPWARSAPSWTTDLWDAIAVLRTLWNGTAAAFPCGVLWTLRVELIGSAYIYAMVWPLQKVVRNSVIACLLVHAALLVLLVHFSANINLYFVNETGFPAVDENYIFDFEFGLAISHLRLVCTQKGFGKRAIDSNVPANRMLVGLRLLVATVLFVESIVFCSVHFETNILSDSLHMHSWFLSWTEPTGWYYLAPWDHVLSAILLLAAELLPHAAKQKLAGLTWLGSISFGLYLTHGIILYAMACPLYLWLHVRFNASKTLAFAATLTLCSPTLLGAAHLFWKSADTPLGVKVPRWMWDRLQCSGVSMWDRLQRLCRPIQQSTTHSCLPL